MQANYRTSLAFEFRAVPPKLPTRPSYISEEPGGESMFGFLPAAVCHSSLITTRSWTSDGGDE